MKDEKPMPMDYAPYHTMFEFDEGITAYMEKQYRNPYTEPRQRLAVQAWDSGEVCHARHATCSRTVGNNLTETQKPR